MTKTLIENIEATRKALRDVESDLHAMQAEDLGLKMNLGDALARARMGEKKAQGEASRISMDRAKLSSEIDRLQGEHNALKQRLSDLEEQSHAEHSEALRNRWADIVAEAREMEQQFGEQIIAAAKAAQRLEQLERDYTQVQRAVIASGEAFASPGRPPAPTAGLLSPSVIKAPDASVNNWHHKYGANVLPMNEVRNAFTDAIRAEGKLIAEARKAERDRLREDGLSIVVQDDEFGRRRGRIRQGVA